MPTYAEALKNNDSVTFQQIAEKRIIKTFNKILESIDIANDTSEEGAVLSDINDKAEELGAIDVNYQDGIVQVIFDSKDVVVDFADFLDDIDDVEDYEMNFLHDEGDSDFPEDEVEMDNISDEGDYEYEFIIEINPNIVNYSNEELSEAGVMRKMVRHGQIVKKMDCPPGMKLVNGHCVAMKSAEKNARKRAGIKAAKKRAPKMAKIAKRMKISNMIRQRKGLDK